MSVVSITILLIYTRSDNEEDSNLIDTGDQSESINQNLGIYVLPVRIQAYVLQTDEASLI